MRLFCAISTAFIVMNSPSDVLAQFKVEPDKENVVASRLEGKWQYDAELSKRLTGRKNPARNRITRSFKSNPEIVAKIPAKYGKSLAKRRIYMASVMTMDFGNATYKHPFILIEHRGNPHVVWFRERDGDPLGDAESFNVMLAVAKEGANDLLFIGGDFNNQPFSAYSRVKDDKEK